MRVNGHRIRPIDAHDARKLPDGSVVLYARMHFEYKTGKPLGADYYRCIVGTRRTVSGPEKCVISQPDADWPGIPAWRRGWVWLAGDSVTGYCVIEEG